MPANSQTNSRATETTKAGIEPSVLYLGTPVVLISTLNADGSVNVAPMSSAWWLGWSCMLGLDASSKTVENLLRDGECVLNMPSAAQVVHVDGLARLTGSDPVPRHKQRLGFAHEADKLTAGQLNTEASETVRPPRIAQCPIQMEASLVGHRPFADGDPRFPIKALAIEVRVTRVHADREILSTRFRNRIDPGKWKPLLMSFLRFFSTSAEVAPSRLAEVPEEYWSARRPVKIASTGEADDHIDHDPLPAQRSDEHDGIHSQGGQQQ